MQGPILGSLHMSGYKYSTAWRVRETYSRLVTVTIHIATLVIPINNYLLSPPGPPNREPERIEF